MKAYLPPGSGLPKVGDRLLDKYRIERLVGQGGAGVVYAAHHEALDQRVALKLLLAEPESEAAIRFVNEAKLAARITSEHVCRVMDVGTLPTGVPYIAMEYLEGRDLDAVLAVGAVSVDLVCEYVLQALDAIAQAHAQGIVHRDLKPSNLYLAARAGGPPIIKVLDFGISKGDVLGTEQNVTSSRAILGSPSYMSPEQIKNARNVDARTDIWALGVIMFELTAGRAPFMGETVGEVFAKILEAEPPRLRELVPDVPEAFEAAVMRCLAGDRENRFANVGELAEELAPFASGIGPALVARIRGVISPPTTLDLSKLESPMARREPSSVGSATAAPWTESREAPRRRGRMLIVPVAFLLGGASVYLAVSSRPALLPPDSQQQQQQGGSALDVAGPAEGGTMAALEALDAAPTTMFDAALADGAADAALDADAGEEEEEDDDGGLEEDDDDGGVEPAGATANAPRKAPSKTGKPGPRKTTKKKKTPTKRTTKR